MASNSGDAKMEEVDKICLAKNGILMFCVNATERVNYESNGK